MTTNGDTELEDYRAREAGLRSHVTERRVRQIVDERCTEMLRAVVEAMRDPLAANDDAIDRALSTLPPADTKEMRRVEPERAEEGRDAYRQRGLYGKYHVERRDGSSAAGGKHQHCEYYVLDLTHDEYAGQALLAYARACREKYPQLANDLFHKLPAIAARTEEVGLAQPAAPVPVMPEIPHLPEKPSEASDSCAMVWIGPVPYMDGVESAIMQFADYEQLRNVADQSRDAAIAYRTEAERQKLNAEVALMKVQGIRQDRDLAVEQRNALQAKLDAMNTCVVCHATLLPNETPPHCHDCPLGDYEAEPVDEPSPVPASQAGAGAKCAACGGDGYFKGPRLGDEPCLDCNGTGIASPASQAGARSDKHASNCEMAEPDGNFCDCGLAERRKAGARSAEALAKIALDAIGDNGCDCDDDLDGIESADRKIDQHQCLAGKCEAAISSASVRIAELEEQVRRLTGDIETRHGHDGSPDAACEICEELATSQQTVREQAQEIERLDHGWQQASRLLATASTEAARGMRERAGEAINARVRRDGHGYALAYNHGIHDAAAVVAALPLSQPTAAEEVKPS